jgi:hypothetical protein
MISTSTFSLVSLVSLVVAGLVKCQINGIDIQDMYEETEHILFDDDGTNNDAFINAVTPCSNYVGFQSGGSSQGEQSSAQWVRIVFHDMVTADLSAGTG